jgi:cbb3-type cytochrome oxidase cytochrome c subunit
MIDLNALFHRSPVAIVAIGAAVFGALSFLIALRPAIELDASTPLSLRAQSAAAARGRALYLAEGCGYCHSQLVRPIFVDAADDYVLALGEPFLPRSKVALPRREALDLVAYLQTLKQE